jgi:hypothetical protein
MAWYRLRATAELTIRNHQFDRQSYVPATKVKLVIKNADTTPEKSRLRAEARVVAGGQEIIVMSGRLRGHV